ncbi:MAG: glycosyltransferase family A protein [Cyanobacteria bacterium J06648_1]
MKKKRDLGNVGVKIKKKASTRNREKLSQFPTIVRQKVIISPDSDRLLDSPLHYYVGGDARQPSSKYMPKPKISIIIPAYNAAKTIIDTVDSVRQQTINDWELIIVNDGSTDNTQEIVEAISEPRLKLITFTNGGVAQARNRGIAEAQGKYVAFLDADDLWLPNKLERQLQALEGTPEAIAAYSWTYFMDEQQDGYVYHSSPGYQYEGDVYPQLLQGDFIHTGSNILVHRQALTQAGGFDSQYTGCEDWDMWLRLAAIGNFVVVPQHQIFYRRAVGSATSNVGQMYQQGLLIIDKAYRAAPSHLQYLRSRTEANLHMYVASLYLQHGNDSLQIKQAGQHLRWAIAKYYRILKQTYMLKLLIKFALRYFLPTVAGRKIFEKLRTAIATDNPLEEVKSNK